MIFCSCGRIFGSDEALLQHREDRLRTHPDSKRRNLPPSNPPGSGGRTPTSLTSARGLVFLGQRDQWMRHGAGDKISSISYDSLQLSGEEPVVSSSDGYKLLCSYNWVDLAKPTVYVPGGAPVYKSITLPTTPAPNNKLQYIDQNTARLPQFPFEVVFHAAEVMNRQIKFDTIDILINRNSLRKFLDFCQGRTGDSFRVNLFVVNNTLIVERCTRSAMVVVHGFGDQQSNLGHAFEQAVTELPTNLQGSTSHHRVLRYNLGGLQCAVRFEVDACVVEDSARSWPEAAETPYVAHEDAVESLLGDLNTLNLSREGLGVERGSVTVIPRGDGTVQEQTGEIKANSNAPRKSIPQMWFGRTPYLIRGHHDKENFTHVSVNDMAREFETWEGSAQNQPALQKMVLLLSRLRDLVKTTEKKSCVAIYQKVPGRPTLGVFVSTSARAPLPEAVIEKFWEGQH